MAPTGFLPICIFLNFTPKLFLKNNDRTPFYLPSEEVPYTLHHIYLSKSLVTGKVPTRVRTVVERTRLPLGYITCAL